MPKTIKWIVSHLPTEAVIVMSRETGDVTSASPAARTLMTAFGEQAIVQSSHQLLDDEECIKQFALLHPTAEETYLGWNEVYLKFTARRVDQLPMLRIVVIERLPVYDDLVHELELMSYIAESLPKGIGLHCMKSDQSEARFVYVSALFGTLVGCSLEDLEYIGLAQSYDVHYSDRQKAALMFNCMANLEDGSWTIRLNLNGDFEWRKFVTRNTVGEEGLVMTSMTVEAVSGSAVDDELANASLLRSFLSSTFDVSFYVDTQFRFIDDSDRLRVFFGESHIRNMRLTDFIQLDEDKKRFQEFVVHPLQLRDPDSTTVPMIRLKLVLADRITTEAQIYVCPTYSDIRGTYLLAIRKVTGANEALRSAAKCAVPERPGQTDIVSIKNSVTSNTQTPTGVLEEESSQASDSQELSVESTDNSPRTRMSRPRRIMVAYALQRFLARDLFHSLVYSGQKDWLTPYYDVADLAVMEEELVRSLPATLQGDFVRASRQGIYTACSQILGFSVEGNVGILPPCAKPLLDNVDLIHCAYRFFVGMVPQLPGKDALELLSLLDKAIERVGPKMQRSGTEVITLEFVSMLITTAIRRVNLFQTASHLQWLRHYFSTAMKLPGTKPAEKVRRLPTTYHICTLWACLMHIFDREEEARALLEKIQSDMEQYCNRHPESIAVRTLQSNAVFNLALLYIKRGNSAMGKCSLSKLQIIIQDTHFRIPDRCYELVEWAKKSKILANTQIY